MSNSEEPRELEVRADKSAVRKRCDQSLQIVASVYTSEDSGMSFEDLRALIDSLEEAAEKYASQRSESGKKRVSMLDAIDWAVEAALARIELRSIHGVLSTEEATREVEKIKLAYSYLVSKWPFDTGIYSLHTILNS